MIGLRIGAWFLTLALAGTTLKVVLGFTYLSHILLLSIAAEAVLLGTIIGLLWVTGDH